MAQNNMTSKTDYNKTSDFTNAFRRPYMDYSSYLRDGSSCEKEPCLDSFIGMTKDFALLISAGLGSYLLARALC